MTQFVAVLRCQPASIIKTNNGLWIIPKEMREWCDEVCGPKNVRFNGPYAMFVNENDAVMFLMKFGGTKPSFNFWKEYAPRTRKPRLRPQDHPERGIKK